MVVIKIRLTGILVSLLLISNLSYAQFSNPFNNSILPTTVVNILGLENFEPQLGKPRLFAGISPRMSSIKLDLDAYAALIYLGIPPGYIPPPSDIDADAQVGLEWKTDGYWLGFSAPLSLSPNLGLNLEGMLFSPFSDIAELDARANVLELWRPPFVGTGNKYEGVTGFNVDLEETTWFSIDLNAERSLLYNLNFLLGVQYIYLQSALWGPDTFRGYGVHKILKGNAVAFQQTYVADIPLGARVDVDLNSIFPYVGLRSVTKGWSSELSILLKGSPIALKMGRDAPYKAFMAEAELDYRWFGLSNDFSLDIFARYNHARALFDEIGNIGGVFNEDLVEFTPDKYDEYAQYLRLTEYTNEMSVYWTQLILGAGLTWNFSLDLSMENLF